MKCLFGFWKCRGGLFRCCAGELQWLAPASVCLQGNPNIPFQINLDRSAFINRAHSRGFIHLAREEKDTGRNVNLKLLCNVHLLKITRRLMDGAAAGIYLIVAVWWWLLSSACSYSFLFCRIRRACLRIDQELPVKPESNMSIEIVQRSPAWPSSVVVSISQLAAGGCSHL